MATYHHGDLRSAVLAAASDLVEQEGLAGLSVREAARRAGVSHNAPYRHFPDREALLVELAADGFAALDKVLNGKSGRELGEAYVRFALTHPQRFRLMFMKGEPRATYERFAGAFAGSGAEAKVAAAAAWALIHGLAGLIHDGHLENDEGFVRRVLGSIRFAVSQRSE